MSSEVYITRFLAHLDADTTITLSWAGTYSTTTLKYSTDRKNYTTVATDLTVKKYTIENLSQATLYYFTITPYTADGEAGTTRILYVTTSYTAKIKSISAGSSSTTAIPISWTGSYYSTRVYYKKAADDDSMYVYATPSSGASSYLVQNLDTNTYYNFYVVPFDLNDISGSKSSVLTAKTDYYSYVSTLSTTLSAKYVVANWTGYYSSARMQISSDNSTFTTVSYYTPTTKPTTTGSYTYSGLSPYTTYYFRTASYSTNYNRGGYMTISGETLAGFNTAYVETTTDTEIDLSWNGKYTSADIYISEDGGTTYTVYDTVSAEVYTYTVSNLTNKKTYYFYLLPYKYTELGVSSDIFTGTTDFLADVSAELGTPTIYSIPIHLKYQEDSDTFFMYSSCKIQISTDNSTFSDLSTITQVLTVDSSDDIIYTATNLLPCFTYYLRALPYSNTTAGNEVILSHSTLGNVVSTAVFIDSDNYIVLNWTGYYKYTYVEYDTDPTMSAPVSSLVARDDAYSDTTTELISTSTTLSELSSDTTYYYRFTPINYDGDYGAATTTTLYNATVSKFILSDISTTYITFSVDGTYDYYKIQSSTDNSTFTDVSTVRGEITAPKITTTTAATTRKYYRAVPYNTADSAGRKPDAIYNPIITDISLDITDAHNITLYWTGTYAYAGLQYATSAAGTYADLDTNLSSSTTTKAITTSTISTLDASGTTYYFRLKPYSYAYPTSNVNQGVSITTYNPTITDLSMTAFKGTTSFSSLRVGWRGTYETARVYYDISADFTSAPKYKTITAAAAAGGATLTITDLSSNTKYYVKIIPYNSGAAAGIATTVGATTNSLLTDLSFGYSVYGSSSSAIKLTWSDNSYNTIKVYTSSDTLLGTYGRTTLTTTNSSLTSNSAYTYYAVVYDSSSNVETAATITAYTRASTAELGLTSSVSGATATFSWANAGYTQISIQNPNGRTVSYTSTGGTTNHNTAADDLSRNAIYTYTMIVYNPVGTGSSFTKSITTEAIITDASFSTAAGTISSSALPVSYRGYFRNVYVRVIDQDTGEIIGNTLVSSGSSYATEGTYTISSLSKAAHTYAVDFYPVNVSFAVAGASIESIVATTLGQITDISAAPIDASSILVSIDSSHTYLVFERALDADFSNERTVLRATDDISVDGLYPNTKYYFRATPVVAPTAAIGDMSGVVSSTAATTTWGKINTFAAGLPTKTAVPLTWEGSYNCVSVNYTAAAPTYLDVSATTVYGNTLTIDNLYPNTEYTFRARPINDVSAVGASYYTSTITYPAAYGVYIKNITATGFDISLNGAYSTFYVAELSGNTTSDVGTYGNVVSLSGLSANSTYSVGTYTYNKASAQTYTEFSDVATTLGTLSSATATDISFTYATIAITGEFTSYRLLFWKSGSDASYTTYVSYGTSTTLTNLTANATYYYVPLVNNKSVGAGTDASDGIYNFTTSSSAVDFSVKSYNTDSLVFNMYEGTFTKLRIRTSTTADMTTGLLYSVDISNSEISPVYGNTYTQSGLSENTQYYITATTVNSAGTEGSATSTIAAATLGNITAFALSSVVDITKSAIPLSWTGTYSTALVEYKETSAVSYTSFATYTNAGTPTSTAVSGNTFVSGLAANASYLFRITPINVEGTSGTAVVLSDVSAMTLTSIRYMMAASYDSSAVALTWDGSFDSVMVWVSDVSGQYTGTATTYTGASAIWGGLAAGNTQYYFKIAAYNEMGVGDIMTDASAYTYPRATKLIAAQLDMSAVSLAWDGSFSTVRVYASDVSGSYNTTVYKDFAGNSGVYDGLAYGNTNYYFKIVPSGVVATLYTHPAAIISDVSAYTYPRTTRLTTAQLDMSAVSLTWDGSFSSVRVYASDVSGVYGSVSKDFYYPTRAAVFDGLAYGNTNYYFKIVPSGVVAALYTHPAAIISDVSAYTYPRATRLTTAQLDMSAVSLTWDGSFSSVRVYASDVSGTYNTTVYKEFYYPTRAGVFDGLAYGNTNYYFKIVPSGVVASLYTHPAAIISDVSAYTYPRTTRLITAQLDMSAVSLAWDGSFSSVRIYATDTSGSYNTTVYKEFYYPTRVAVYDGLAYGNTNYYFKIVPSGVAASLYTHPAAIVSDVSAYTYPTITKLVAASYLNDSSAVSLTWDGSFSTVRIYASDVSGTYNTTVYKEITYPTRAAVYDGLAYGNTKYYFKIVPSGVAASLYTHPAAIITDASAYTYPRATRFVAASYDSSAATITWDGSYDSVQVWVSDVSGQYTGTATTYTAPTKSAIYKDLTYGNTTYYFKLAPVGVAGTGVAIQDASALTYATVKSLTVAAYDTSSVQLTWDGSFSYMTVYSTTVSGSYDGAATTYYYPQRTAIYSDISAGTVYYFKIDSYNSLGKGTTLKDIQSAYIAVLTSARADALDMSAITLSWSGTYDSVYIWMSDVASTYTGVATTVSGQSSYVYSGLTYGNTQYYFKLTPFNTDSGFGTAWTDVAAYTNARATKLNAASYDSSAVSLTWDGSFSEVRVFATDVSGSYGTTYTTFTGREGVFGGLAYGNTNYYFKIVPVGVNGATTHPAAVISDVSAYTYPNITKFINKFNTKDYITALPSSTTASLKLFYPFTQDIYNYVSSTSGVSDASYVGSTVSLSSTTSAFDTKSSLNSSTRSNTSYLQLSAPSANTSGYSFSIWFKLTETTAGMIFSLCNSTASLGVYMYWNGSGIRAGTFYNYAGYYKTLSSYTLDGSTYLSFTTDTWYHIAYTLTSNLSNSILTWYVNGVKQSSITAYCTPSFTFSSDNCRLLGNNTANGYIGYGIVGYVNDFRYYDGILTDTEVLNISLETTEYYTSSYVSDISSVSLTWDGSFSSVRIYASDVSGTYNYLTKDFNYPTRTAVFNGLAYGNTNYYFKIVPSGVVATLYTHPAAIVSDVSAYTYPRATKLITAQLDMSAVSLTWDGSFSSVRVYVSDVSGTYNTTVYKDFTGRSGIYNGLTYGNTNYYFKIVPSGVVASLYTHPAAILTDVSAYTYPQTTRLTAAQLDMSAVSLTWDGSFSSVRIYATDVSGTYNTTVYKDFTYPTRSGIYDGLAYGNTNYYFKIVPSGVAASLYTHSAAILTDVSAYTYPRATSLVAAGLDMSAVSLTWDGSFSSVRVYATDTAGVYGSLSKDFAGRAGVFDGLTYGNTNYYFKIVPNGVAATLYTHPAAIVSDINAYTYPRATKLTTTVFDSSAVSLAWDGSFSTVRIYATDVSGTYNTTVYKEFTYPTRAGIYDGLTYGNTNYYFKIVPSGTAATLYTHPAAILTDVSAYTYARATRLTTTAYDTSAITLTWDGSFSSVYIYASDTSGSYTTYTEYPSTTRTTTFAGFSYANYTYYFKIVPVGVLGATTKDYNAILTDISGMTKPYIRTMTATPYDTSAITITWDASAEITTLYRATNSTTYPNSTATQYRNVATAFITALEPNLQYYFKAVPINRVGVSGEPYYITTITQPRAFGLDVSNSVAITASSIPLKWDGSFNKVAVEYSANSGSTYTFAFLCDNSSAVVSGLSANTQYYFRITPTNAYNVSGTTIYLTSTAATTLASVSSITTTAIYDTSAVVVVEGSYNRVLVYTSPASLNKTYTTTYSNTGIITTGTDLSGLTPYTSYTIYAIGYNQNSAAGTAFSTNIVTDPKLSTVGVTHTRTAAIDSSSIPITWTWTGSRGNVYIETTTDATLTTFNFNSVVYNSATGNTVVAGLASNARYYMRLTPFGFAADSSGWPVIMNDTSAVTLGRITDVSYTTYDTSAQLYVDGSFTYITVYSASTRPALTKTYYYVGGGAAKTTTAADLSGMTANSLASVVITPYNSLSRAGQSTTYQFYTAPNITKFYTSDYDVSSIKLTIDGSYNTATILWYASGDSYSFTDTPYSTTVSYPVGSTIVSGLTAQTKYYFRITPIGYNSMTGTTKDASGFTMFDFSGAVFGMLGYGVSGQLIRINPAYFDETLTVFMGYGISNELTAIV